LVLSLLAEHHETADIEDALSAPLFLADCGAQCCGARAFVEEAETKIQAATRAQPVAGTH